MKKKKGMKENTITSSWKYFQVLESKYGPANTFKGYDS